MPELPEVIVTVSRIRDQLLSRKVVEVEVLWERSLASCTSKGFCSAVQGAKVIDIFNRGKLIVFELESTRHDRTIKKNKTIFSCHLRMSGRLEVEEGSAYQSSHHRLIFKFDNGTELRFKDVRKFGKFLIGESAERGILKLGPAPNEERFTFEFFKQALSYSKRRIKPVLLDQSIIAGLGNIYVDEVLWASKIHPEQQTNKIGESQLRLLHASIRRIIASAIKLGGTDFGDGVVPGGRYSPKIYGRAGKKCNRCRSVIERIVVGQRGTHICPECQKSSAR